MSHTEILDQTIRRLRLRCGEAYREKNDELLLKIVPVLCKAVETRARLSGEDGGPVELVLRGEDEPVCGLQ